MSRRRLLLSALGVLFLVLVGQKLQGCATTPADGDRQQAEPRALVLVSFDGFRHDYLDRDIDTPALDWMAEGVTARLIPVFPTKTFPNHYSIVTGLYPEQHGIVGNTMRDPERLMDGEPAQFSLSNREAVQSSAWWGGEPIWVTAERQGVTTAPVFWPGSEAEIGGVRPTTWEPYNGAKPYLARVQTVLDALDAGAGYASMYAEEVDNAGHRYGPDSPEVAEAVSVVDAMLDALIDGLRQRGRLDDTDIVVTSDHGMTGLSRDRVVLLDDALTVSDHDLIWGEPAGIWPREGQSASEIVDAVNALDHVTAYLREDVPARLRYSDNPRIPPVVIIPDEGWSVTSQSYLIRNPDRPSGGTHGYDNALLSMHGIFLARGPRIRQDVELETLHIVDLYGIMAEALALDPAENAGDPAAIRRVLR
ncbi:MAG: alkaline phosphatase family protein [Bacteroidota bacterium]